MYLRFLCSALFASPIGLQASLDGTPGSRGKQITPISSHGFINNDWFSKVLISKRVRFGEQEFSNESDPF